MFLTAVFASGNLIASALHMLGGFLVVRLVDPTVLGQFQGIILILSYLPILQLGILNGLTRELPFYIGKGNRQRVEELAASAQAWALFIGVFSTVALLGIALWHAFQGNLQFTVGWGIVALLSFLLF